MLDEYEADIIYYKLSYHAVRSVSVQSATSGGLQSNWASSIGYIKMNDYCSNICILVKM